MSVALCVLWPVAGFGAGSPARSAAPVSPVAAPADAISGSTNWLGIWLREPAANEGTDGVVVEWVAPLSPADGRILPDDILIDADGSETHTLGATRAAIAGREWDEGLSLTIRRRKNNLSLTIYPVAAPIIRPFAVDGRFTGERYSGSFKGFLDPIAHTAAGTMQGRGAGTVDLEFSGPWAPDTGEVRLDLKGHVHILFTVSLHGTASGKVDPSGKGRGVFNGSAPVGSERGSWECSGHPSGVEEF